MYSSRVRSGLWQIGQGNSPLPSISWRSRLIGSPTSATGGAPSTEASERFVRTIRQRRSCTTM